MIRQLDNGLTIEVNRLTSGNFKAYLYDPKDSFDLSINKGTATSDTENDAVLSLLVKTYGSNIPKFLDEPKKVETLADYLRTFDVKVLQSNLIQQVRATLPLAIMSNVLHCIEDSIEKGSTAFQTENFTEADHRNVYATACQFLGLNHVFEPSAQDPDYGRHTVSWL